MSARPEVVAAAEALRAWVVQQRESWQPLSDPGPADAPPLASTDEEAIPVLTSAFAARTLFGAEPSVDVPAVDSDVERRIVWWPRVRRVLAVAGTAAAALTIAALLGAAGKTAWTRLVSRATGIAIVESSPSGSQVLVDGTAVGETPMQIPLAAGRHVVELRRKGATRAQAVDVTRNGESHVTVDWNVRPKGRLKVDSQPAGARVLVDGREAGVTPLLLPEVVVGAHTVVLESDAGSVRRRVTVAEGSTEELAESIFPGWVRISAPVDVTVSEAGRPVALDDRNRAMLKPGVHQLRIDNPALAISQTAKVEVEPGATTNLDVELPQSTLSVSTNVPASISIDGTAVGDSPLTEIPVKVGTRTIVATDQHGAEQRVTVTVTAQPSRVDITFK